MHDIWNPWHGCIKCSEGCKNCYMYFLDRIRNCNGAHIYKTKGGFTYPLQKYKDGRYKIQSGELIRVCMTSDFFLEEADEWRKDAWEMMRQRPDVKFFLLTKRPQRVADCLPEDWVIVPNTHEAIIDMDIFERAQIRIEEIRKAKSNKGKERVGSLSENHLHLKCRCGICGKVMRLRERKSDGAVYECCHSSATNKYEEKSIIVPFEEVETSVFKVIHKRMQTCIEKEDVIRKLNSSFESDERYGSTGGMNQALAVDGAAHIIMI